MSLSIQGNRPGNGRDSLREGAADRILVSITSQLARNVAALVFVAGVCGLAALVVYDRSRAVGAPAASSAALTAAVAVVARGVYLGRPVTAAHAAMALLLLFGVVGAHLIGASLWCATMAVAAAAALACPTASRPDPAAVPDASAAVAYRTRLGLAVVSGDPIGQPEAFGELVDGFAALCRGRGWRIVVLGCSKDRLSLWQGAGVIRPALHVVPIGCDVEVDVQRFALTGRRFRNLRQAVARTRHRGVTTQLIDEQDLDPTLAAELAGVLHASHHATRWERGFSMILDSALEERYPGVVLMIVASSRGLSRSVR